MQPTHPAVTRPAHRLGGHGRADPSPVLRNLWAATALPRPLVVQRGHCASVRVWLGEAGRCACSSHGPSLLLPAPPLPKPDPSEQLALSVRGSQGERNLGGRPQLKALLRCLASDEAGSRPLAPEEGAGQPREIPARKRTARVEWSRCALNGGLGSGVCPDGSLLASFFQKLCPWWHIPLGIPGAPVSSRQKSRPEGVSEDTPEGGLVLLSW